MVQGRLRPCEGRRPRAEREQGLVHLQGVQEAGAGLAFTSPLRGEVEAEAQRRLRVRGLSTHSDSRIDPSPGSYLAMRSDLSPPGRGENLLTDSRREEE